MSKKETKEEFFNTLKGVSTQINNKSKNSQYADDDDVIDDRRSNTVIKYTIRENDNAIVKLLKKEINRQNLTLQDLYKKYGAVRGYNLFYALKVRANQKISNLKKWEPIIKKRIKVTLVDIEKE